MLGSIAGDIAGSPWEGGDGCTPNAFSLFGEDCVFTDDTVLSVAIADALTTGSPVADSLRTWTKRYPGRGYGGGFIDWAHTPDKPAYGSSMNGGAMRVASVGWLAKTEEECWSLAKLTAEVTHNHPDGSLGAQAIALAVWLARQQIPPLAIRDIVSQRTGYDLTASVSDLRGGYGASTWANDSVPIAIVSALESKSWLDAVRNAVSIGGDCDTTGCMAGEIAEAMHGLPSFIASATVLRIPPEMVAVVQRVYTHANQPLPWRKLSVIQQWRERVVHFMTT